MNWPPPSNARSRSRSARRAACAAALLLAVVATSDRVTTVVHTQPAPDPQGLQKCRPLDEKLWAVAQESMGLFVTDDNRRIGGAVGNVKFSPRSFVGRLGNTFVGGYTPVSGFKEMACGTLRKLSLYKGPPPELDFHPHIKLSPMFEHIAIQKGNSDCKQCVWGEVTPPKLFEWAWKPAGGTPPERGDNKCDSQSKVCGGRIIQLAQEGKLCMYGPWVVEAAHGNRPEIHPVQAFWGQTADHTALYVMNDDSDRFQLARYFTEQHLSPAFAPWSGSQRLTISALVRLTASKATLDIKDDGPESALIGQPITIGASELALKRPAWLPFRVTHACLADGATGRSTQVLLESSLPLDGKITWRSLEFKGSHTGITYTRASTATRASSGPEKEDAEERWGLRSVLEWSEPVDLVRRNWPNSARHWGVSETGTAWNGILDQRLVLEALPTTEDASKPLLEEPRATWAVTITDLETNRAVRLDDVAIWLEHPREAVVTVTEGVRRTPTRRANAFALVIQFPKTAAADRRVHLRNLKVNVTARIADRHRTEEARATIYSIVPNFLGEIAGYDPRRNSGAFPEILTELFVPWLNANECATTAANFRRDLAGDPTPSDLSHLRGLLHPRLLHAGILRQTVNMALQDRTIDVNEYIAVKNAAWGYARACQSSSTW